jgi:hypothetical protein
MYMIFTVFSCFQTFCTVGYAIQIGQTASPMFMFGLIFLFFYVAAITVSFQAYRELKALTHE